jgi:hypothetical protein
MPVALLRSLATIFASDSEVYRFFFLPSLPWQEHILFASHFCSILLELTIAILLHVIPLLVGPWSFPVSVLHVGDVVCGFDCHKYFPFFVSPWAELP